MRLNPFRSGQCLSTVTRRLDEKVQKSQSLSIRAMSFDNLADTVAQAQSLSQSLSIRAMSFDTYSKTTYETRRVSIPFDQGYVFRHIDATAHLKLGTSQSLSNRAMSFDLSEEEINKVITESQSLSNRAMSFDTVAGLSIVESWASQSLSNRAMSFD